MRRDDVALHAAIDRRAGYLGGGEDACFAWLHQSPGTAPAGCVAVICPPIGHEYTRAHRSLRHLADRLAVAGVPALRFDYHGIGDSPGSDLDPGRVARWQADIRAAIAQAREMTGCERVCLVGVRMGASLAYLEAAANAVDRLVLWNPCVKGKRFVRELQAIAQSAARADEPGDGTLESAGFLMSAETAESIKAIDLLEHVPRVRERVLLVGRDDMAEDDALPRHLAASGVPHEGIRPPGWAGMMAEHQFTVVPDEALGMIADWVRAGPAAAPPAREGIPRTAFFPSLRLAGNIEEIPCTFGRSGNLFGILARGGGDPSAPVALLLNSGSVHHVGANRVYVALARSLARQGVASLRFDLESIGDSVLRGEGRENYPYPTTATRDALDAIEYLKRAHGYSRFIALGLCSGAHTAFHVGLEAPAGDVTDVVMINPVSFYWEEGMSLELVNNFTDAVAYRKSMRDPARWLKLLRGGVDMRRLAEVSVAQAKAKARSAIDALVEALAPARGPRLSRDLRRLIDLGRRVTLIVAEGDPGRDVLMTGAPVTARRAIRDGKLRVEIVPRGDHTFSRVQPRNAMLRMVEGLLKT